MSEQIKDGGPAFPSHGNMGEVTHVGMTLRDYFAAKAMHALIIKDDESTNADRATDAYRMADAMLRAREAKS